VTKHSKIQKVFGLAAAVVLVGALAAAAYAQSQPQPGPMRHGGRMGMMQGGMGAMGGPMMGPMALGWLTQQLNLTPDQQQQIKTLVQNQKSTFQPLMSQMREAQQNLAQAIVNGDDPTAAANALAAIQSQVTTQGASIASQVFKTVLNDAQRAQAKELLSQWQQKRSQMQQKRQGGPGGK